MNSIVLEEKWKAITYEGNSSFEFKRIDSICIPEFNIGFNSMLNRCLILELPIKNNLDFQSKIQENLTIEFFKDTNYIVIQLTDNNFYDLFNDLIISLYHKIKRISNVDEYSKELITTYYKWIEFFNEKANDRLTLEVIKGLFGELLVLKSLISSAKTSQINSVLSSWTGPYDKGHDFELDIKSIEVKTKDYHKIDIRISSEYQMENDIGKELELIVVSIEEDSINGFSINVLLLEIKYLITEKLGDISIFLKAIAQKGLTFKNIYQYDNFRFKPVNMISYNCLKDGFPKLIKSNIPKEVSAISYNLRLSLLNEFMISKKVF